MNRESFPIEQAPALVQEFVNAHKQYTQAPDEFLASVPLFVASVIAGRWVEFNGQPLNNYFLIVGQTGTSKKSTAQKLALELLQAIKDRLPNLTYKSQPSEGTSELAIKGADSAYPIATHFSIEGLQTHSIGSGTSTAVNMGEYGSLFDVGKRQGQQNTISELTNMYDGNILCVKTVSRNVFAENYSLSILGASTEEWLGEFCSKRNIGGGFVNRHLIFTGQPIRILAKPKKPNSEYMDSIVSKFTILVPGDIQHFVEGNNIKWTGSRRTVGWSPEADCAWLEYYERRTLENRCLKSQVLVELSARELTHAIKLCGLSAFMERRDFVNRKDLEFGAKAARWSVQNALLMMAIPEELGLAEEEQIVLSRLKRSGPMTKRDLLQLIGGKFKGIGRAINILVAKEAIELRPDGCLFIQEGNTDTQQREIEKYFGKSDICEIFDMLVVGTSTENEASSEGVGQL